MKNENDPILVLQVFSVLDMGGAESRIMDLAGNLDPSRVRYAFLLHNRDEDYSKDFYEEEAVRLGCPVYRLPRYKIYNGRAYRKAVREFFKEHPEIDIVQGHMTSVASIYLPIAKETIGAVTIAHARSAGVDPGLKGKLTKFLRRNLKKRCDHCWACSTEAADALYGEDARKNGQVRIIPNAIRVADFAPVEKQIKKGSEIRSAYGLDGKFVVGHIGRFHYAKNHEFLVDIFAEILKVKKDAALLLVGDGDLKKETEEKVKALHLEDKVIFAGRQSNPADFYHAMDLLIFPSRYEGLPGTIVESQAAALPALVSDAVTKDVAVTEYVRYCSLQKNAAEWAGEALGFYEERSRKTEGARETAKQLKEAGFDVESQARMLEELYKSLLEENG